MSDVNDVTESISEAIGTLIEIGGKFGGFSTSNGVGWNLTQAKFMIPDLINLLPFQAGDKIKLTRNHPCPGAWVNSKHFLIKGGKGVIDSIQYYNERGFYADVVFDKESWIDEKGKVRPISDKHTYAMDFKYLKKATII